MVQAAHKPKADGEVWELLREHHGDLAGLKRDVGALGETVGRLVSELPEIQWPT